MRPAELHSAETVATPNTFGAGHTGYKPMFRSPQLLPLTLLLSGLLWLFTTTGGRQIFVKEVLGGAYDSQAEHFLRGDVDVDVEAIGH